MSSTSNMIMGGINPSDSGIESSSTERLNTVIGSGQSAVYNVRPVEQYVRQYKKVQRNDPCPCGSGKKYKHCCLNLGTFEE